MKETNAYGMYSGGYIFDQLDRAALQYVKDKTQMSEKDVLVTMAVDELKFKRQLCDNSNITVRCDKFETINLYSTLYTCYAELLDGDGMVIASGNFVFTTATNHCGIKGGDNE